ncbi:MAG: MarR family winged helix-turn-helix transcriptional regulator [Lachnospiraceae bacterium]
MIESENVCKMIRTNIIHRRIVENSLEGTGVYQGQHRILMRLAEHEYHSQKEIAIAMKVSTATMAIALKKLEKNKYIEKNMDTEDNRLNKIIITEKGQKVIEDSKKILDDIDRKMFQGFSDEDKQKFGKMLEIIEQNLIDMEKEKKKK